LLDGHVKHLEETYWLHLQYKVPADGSSKLHKNGNFCIQEYMASLSGLLLNYLTSLNFHKDEYSFRLKRYRVRILYLFLSFCKNVYYILPLH